MVKVQLIDVEGQIMDFEESTRRKISTKKVCISTDIKKLDENCFSTTINYIHAAAWNSMLCLKGGLLFVK